MNTHLKNSPLLIVLLQIDFLSICYFFKVEAVTDPAPVAPDGIRKMLLLMHCQDGMCHSSNIDPLDRDFMIRPT